MRGWSDNREFLAALLHGRRGRFLEGDRLTGLCGVEGWESAAGGLGVAVAAGGVAGAERGLWRAAGLELNRLTEAYGGEVGEFLRWWRLRFLIRDCCLLLRAGLGTGAGADSSDLFISEGVMGGGDEGRVFEVICGVLPRGGLRERYGAFVRDHPDERRIFMHENVLERAYLGGLYERALRLGREDGERVRCMVDSEVQGAELLFLAAGRFVFEADRIDLDGVREFGRGVSRPRWEAAMEVGTAGELARLFVGGAIDSLPEVREREGITVQDLDGLVFSRQWRLANRVFRGSAMSYGVAVGYAALKWLEIKLATRLLEGLRLGLGRERLTARLTALQRGGGG